MTITCKRSYNEIFCEEIQSIENYKIKSMLKEYFKKQPNNDFKTDNLLNLGNDALSKSSKLIEAHFEMLSLDMIKLEPIKKVNYDSWVEHLKSLLENIPQIKLVKDSVDEAKTSQYSSDSIFDTAHTETVGPNGLAGQTDVEQFHD